MNYKHAFHAGNFADVFKHAVVLQVLAALQRDPRPLQIIDTHAGAGLYDLEGDEARRTREAEAGIVRLAGDPEAPAAFKPLLDAVRACNQDGLRFYPGSSLMMGRRLRPADLLTACDLNPEVLKNLSHWMGECGRHSHARQGDGFACANEIAAKARDRLLLLIDPPFEDGSDHARMIATCREVLQASPTAVIANWLPLKDLDTFDRFLSGMEALGRPHLQAAELRLRPLHDPMRMNGCALVMFNPPADLGAPLLAIGEWCAQKLGGTGAKFRAYALS